MDVKDLKILYELDLDSRLSIKQLARRIGLSAEATRYRLNRFERKKIISSFITYLNFNKLGYFGYCTYCRYNNITESKKEEIKESLKENEKVYWVAEYGGKFDLAFSIFAKDPLEFDSILNSIMNKYSSHLTDIKIIIKLEPHKYSRKYLKEEGRVENGNTTCQIESCKLTNTEKRILKKLSTNSRMTSADISSDIGIPLSTVIYTIKKLKNKKIIGGYSVVVDPDKFGYQSYQANIVTQNITKEKLERLFSYCKNHTNITLAIKVLGDWNFEIIYEVENAKKMQNNLIELRNKFDDIIKSAELINIFEDYIKLDHYPFKIY